MYLVLEKEINDSESHFATKIAHNQKKHVITSNYTFKRGDIVDVVVASPEELQANDPVVVASLKIFSTQTIAINFERGILKIFIDGVLTDASHDVIFVNEGISVNNFIKHNFKNGDGTFHGIILHFTPLQY